jgi:hypothetical protein
MTTRSSSNILRNLVWSIAALNLVMVLTALFGQISSPGGKGGLSIDSVVAVIWMFNSSIYTLLALLILSRHPRHTIGWLFLTVGFFTALLVLGSLVKITAHDISSLLLMGLFALLGELTWMVTFMIPLSLVLLYFPDGHLPSRRWWPITAAMLIGMGGYAASLAFHPWPWEAQGIHDSYNPVGIAGSEGFFDTLLSLSTVLVFMGVSGSLMAVVVRFFRSSGIQRAQMKWLVYAAVAIILPVLLLSLAKSLPSIVNFLVYAGPTLLSLAIGNAILRYRLFDIDILIRKTLIYSILTGILGAIYFGGVVLIQRIFQAAVGQTPDVAIVISTLLIAALFSPIRHRVQDTIDRRFYRRKYDAEKTLAKFSQSLRDEVDMETLKDSLVAVVQETMQPTRVALWIQPQSNQKENIS